MEFMAGIRAVIRSKNILIDESFATKLEQERKIIRFNKVVAEWGTTGKIYGINGPVISLKGNLGFKMSEMDYVGGKRLIGEVIGLTREMTTIQVYRETTG